MLALATRRRQKSRFHRTPLKSMRTPRILCVDDDPDLQTTIQIRMRKYRVEIDQAFCGMQGITSALQNAPDLILMDQSMPHGDGQYLLEAVKRNPSTSMIPVIVLTGMRDTNLKARLLQAGADAFLQKSIQFDELVHHISRFIDLREQESEGKK